jgi:crotonobetainyl-CoA:carnitine CoA-transferase CaiB-like acyl-CoA transferase
MYAYSAILAALLRRERTGEGAALEVSLFEALGEWMGFPVYYAMYGGDEPPRSGARHASIAPYGPFECGDGERIFFGVQNEREWESFCEAVLGRPEMASDELFDTNSRRVENREALEEEISAVLGELSSQETIERLERAGIANARMRTVSEFIEHPQLAARDRWREIHSPAGPLQALLPPAAMANTDPVMAPIPGVGEHTDEILEELGYDQGAVAALRREAAI